MLTKKIVIRGYHCDAYGHVNNARYLEFFEECRWTFLDPALQKGVFTELGLLFVVVNIELDYKKPLLPGDIAEVNIVDLEYSNMSITIYQSITVNSDLYTKARVKFVLLDANTQKASKITSDIQSIFESLKEA